jgi:predicted Rossmann fold flavoprotein
MRDEVLGADRVVIAAGGLSVPATGSTGFGFEVARSLAHVVHPPYPALTPLTAEPAVHAPLAGVSLTVSLAATSPEESSRATGGFLFTHRGYSGPAVLDISHVAVRSLLLGGPPARVRVRWTDLDATAWTRELAQARSLVTTAVARRVPHRLAEHLVGNAGIAPERTCAQLRRDERLALISRLTDYDLPWTGHEGYRPAEVTGGGVSLEDLRRQTLESRRAAGLFFCGEVLDAFGPIGGHNFQWAWSTGRTAGRGAAG